MAIAPQGQPVGGAPLLAQAPSSILIFDTALSTTTPFVSSAAGSGNYWYITALKIAIRGDATVTGGSVPGTLLKFTTGGDNIIFEPAFIPGTAGTVPFYPIIVNFVSPIKSLQTNDTISASLTLALTTGIVGIDVWGYAGP